MTTVRSLTVVMLLPVCGLFSGCAAEDVPADPVGGASGSTAVLSNPHDTPRVTERSDLPAEAQSDSQPAGGPSSHPQPPAVALTKIKFKTADGQVSMSLKPAADGAKLVDADERELARYTLRGDKLKIKNAADETLGYIVAYPDRLKVKDAQQKNDLWQLRRQSDGDWKLEDAKGTMVCRVKKRDYGFEIEKPDDTSLQKVKLKDGKLSLRKSEETYLYTKDRMSPAAAACLALEPVESQSVRMGLATLMLIKFPSR
ncbi:MAG: hypothetical protein NXI04_03910 [Planctomycetaceae bacterium]|nr:hypothetical protein [Planctomycetaceae bacterium]